MPIPVAQSIGFFRQTVQTIISNFSLLFNQASEEVEDGETEEERTNSKHQEDGLMGFGIIPYILKYCEVTNETITSVMNESVSFVFYIVSYEILESKRTRKATKTDKK